ncbi:DUF899 domain-containing protein [Actinomadura sp. 6K520]|jgi:predicted dithiol-disulfide oxidoreductase (DUF899 family)|uniref:DUF899 domain-containing protein n=1 Tax=Actinomadura sp. 6K520 TaxID=2530364 RepID=UPI001052E6AA|nr:DUF899 domain-containing protein [Actinomadura sp. 6K520]TDE38177.1 DUF899 domain-containing protein [Actinomadura sp. 6K520]
MALPEVVSREEWTAARKRLLAKEKELTRARDALNAERRRLPMVRVEKDYVFEGPDGGASLLDLFHGRRQLILGHTMWDPGWDRPCRSCSSGLAEISVGHLRHLNERDTTYVAVSRAPQSKIAPFRAEMGWVFPWYSSYGSDFNYDYHVTIDGSVAPEEYNYRPLPPEGDRPMELPGTSCFLRDGDTVYHTYSMFARGAEQVGGAYYFLDLTALGRQEEWEEPKDRGSGGMPAGSRLPYPDEYDDEYSS